MPEAEAAPAPPPTAPVARPLDTSTVKLTANLSKDKVAAEQKSIERLKADPHGFVNRYRIEFEDHFNPDNAAELFPDYCSSPENRAKFRTAGWCRYGRRASGSENGAGAARVR